MSGKTQVSTQSDFNYGDARVGIVTVTATYDGVAYEIKYAIRQKGLVGTAFTNKLIKLSPTGVASNLVSPVATSNIDHISVCGDTCFLSGSFTNLFGQAGKNRCVPVGITANATKAIVQNGVPFSIPYVPEVMLRGYLSRPYCDDPRGNPLYGFRDFKLHSIMVQIFFMISMQQPSEWNLRGSLLGRPVKDNYPYPPFVHGVSKWFLLRYTICCLIIIITGLCLMEARLLKGVHDIKWDRTGRTNTTRYLHNLILAVSLDVAKSMLR